MLIWQSVDTARIAELLKPFLGPSASEGGAKKPLLSQVQLEDILTYINLLLRWNARINLTAIRDPEHIVTRHFGESFFAARHLFPATRPRRERLIDIGSGAGFPGLPIKLWAPELDVTLIESNQKKATFLREIIRALRLTDINVFAGRAEDLQSQAEVATLRAVERFESALPQAVRLRAPAGRLALLIAESQVATARVLSPQIQWSEPIPTPLSSHRVLLVSQAG